jgi:E2/UBC family protein E
MSSNSHQVHVFINHARLGFEHRIRTGGEIKSRAEVPADHILCLDVGHHHPHDECGCDRDHQGGELRTISDDERIELEEGEHFWTHAPASQGIAVTINRKSYDFADAHQTGRSLKERAGIVLTDVLFLDRPKEDEVIGDDTKVVLKCDDCFHSSPPANYGAPTLVAADVGFECFQSHAQADGWTYLVVPDYQLPDGYTPDVSQLLIKLPPLFPDAAPDMFWVNPHIRTSSDGVPQGTSTESLLGESWQRFSWHLSPGAWRPGISTLRDFMRCVRSRFEKRN